MTLAKKIGVIFALILIFLATFGALTYAGAQSAAEAQRWKNHTLEVVIELQEFYQDLLDMETGQRGYVLTGDETYLEPYRLGLEDLKVHSARVGELIIDPAQLERWHAVQPLVLQKSAELATVIELRKSRGAEVALQVVKAGHGKQIMDQIRAQIDQMMIEERRLNALRTALASSAAQRLDWGILLGGLLVMGALGAAGYWLALNITQGIRSVQQGALIVAQGNLNHRIQVVSRDEIGTLATSFNQMTEALQKTMVSADTEKAAMAYTRSLIEASIDPLVTIGPDGKITDVNQSTEAITGIPRAQLLATDFADYFTDPDKARQGYLQVFRQGLVRDYPLELRHRGGRVTPVLYNASVYKDASGQVVGVFAAARDVTDLKKEEWIKSGLARLNDAMRGEADLTRLAAKIITELCHWLGAMVGVLFVAQEDGAEAGALTLLASYAHTQRKNLANQFKPGEGLVGQAALERKQIILQNAPDDYIRVVSGLGEAPPRFLCVTPFVFQDQVRGAAEIGTLGELGAGHLDYLEQAAQAVAIALESAQGRVRLDRELQRSQQLGLELQAQQEELRVTNEELQMQAQTLVASQQKLQAQEEELRVSNEELMEKNDLLVRQKRDVEIARREISEKATELELASKYKSEFLANMSHELRTPLNSLLLLARGLADNRSGNLTLDQVESAQVVYSAGHDLLTLINDILDLSKIEAGRMDLVCAPVTLQELAETLEAGFAPLAKEQEIDLRVEIEEGLPAVIRTDFKRAQQILKNLLSNALKFTEQGSVTVRCHRPAPGVRLSSSGLDPSLAVAISVIDTGIGIAPEHQKRIFEAFQQVDGGIARKYGGTGLGLSISRELARLLGGEIQLTSQADKGSTFTLYLPVAAPQGGEVAPPPIAVPVTPSLRARPAPDDRQALGEGDRAILVIEDDALFAGILLKKCHEKGLKCLVAGSGEEGLELCRKLLPQAILLDIKLPGMDGWQVLDSLKNDVRVRHIPVHILSGDEPTIKAFHKGAIGQLSKPVAAEEIEAAIAALLDSSSQRTKRLLVVEDDEPMRRHLVELLKGDDVVVDEAGGAHEAQQALASQRYDCVVLDLGLCDMDGEELMRQLSHDHTGELPPVIVYTARDVTREQEARLREYTDSIIVKDVRSEERLIDEVSLFLHRVVGEMKPRQRQMITDLHSTSDSMLVGRRILIVDDDMRSAFSLSKLLADFGMKSVKAENGEKALQVLAEGQSIDLILMDIMMPVMDGHDAIRRIRAQEQFARTPIIVLTAKAMAGDREKCLASGANDYLTKPIDRDRLLSLLRVWLTASPAAKPASS